MRDNLLGYLLNAVEPEERSAIEQHLAHDEQLKKELEVLRTGLHPLSVDELHHQPPVGLAQRCCEYVFSCAAVMPARLSNVDRNAGARSAHRWSWLDLSVAGAIAVAVSVLLLPAIYQSHVESQMLACQNNLKDLGIEAADYSTHNGGYYPAMQPGDRLNEAGMWAPTLASQSYPVTHAVICPSSKLADDSQFRVFTLKELHAMSEAQLAEILPRLGGSYGFTLGYRDGGTYKNQKNRHRKNFAVMADMPGEKGTNSLNHGTLGQNVLWDDGRVSHLGNPQANPDDNIFTNAHGDIAAGLNPDDAVIVDSRVPAE
jgi:hypothetical protein